MTLDLRYVLVLLFSFSVRPFRKPNLSPASLFDSKSDTSDRMERRFF